MSLKYSFSLSSRERLLLCFVSWCFESLVVKLQKIIIILTMTGRNEKGTILFLHIAELYFRQGARMSRADNGDLTRLLARRSIRVFVHHGRCFLSSECGDQTAVNERLRERSNSISRSSQNSILDSSFTVNHDGVIIDHEHHVFLLSHPRKHSAVSSIHFTHKDTLGGSSNHSCSQNT